jgi:NAD(P)-dependent dehydrogenase (short-subunit alcohol dehydrogenase family)
MTSGRSPAGMFSLVDNVVLVSGGSRGIGRAIGLALRDLGANVIVSGRDASSLHATGLEHVVCDVRDEVTIQGSVQEIVQRFGRIDALFNVAGINHRQAAFEFPVETWDEVFAVNVRGAFLMAREAGRVMAHQGRGKIVNIASLHSHQSLPGVAAYGASKGAMASMTRALAVEWAPRGIQVNAIAPGFIRTDLNTSLWERPQLLAWAIGRTPAARLGLPEDLLGTAVFLASRASDFMTGQVLYVDGGLTAGSPWPLEIPGSEEQA